MATFKVYKRESCGACQQATQFLQALQKVRPGIDLKLVDGDSHPDKVRAVLGRLGLSTIPQIFLDGHHIGGWSQLSRWASSGALDAYLETGEFRPPQRRPGFFARLRGQVQETQDSVFK